MIIHHPGGIHSGYTPVLDCHTSHVPCRFDEILHKVDRRSGKALDEPVTSLKTGDSAMVKLVPKKPLCVDTFARFPPLGRFAVRDMKTTVAVGVVKEIVPKANPGGSGPAKKKPGKAPAAGATKGE